MRKHIVVKTLIVVGCIILISGIIFVAQSKSKIGPNTSFMYSNPQWTVNGFAISVIGLIVLACGIIIHFIKNVWQLHARLLVYEYEHDIRNSKVEKETMIVPNITRIKGFIRTIQLGKIIMEGSQKFLIFEILKYARLRKCMLHLFYRTVYENPYSLEKGSKKLPLAVSANRWFNLWP